MYSEERRTDLSEYSVIRFWEIPICVIYLRRSTLYNKTGFQYVSLLLSSKADFDDKLATVIPQLLGGKKKKKKNGTFLIQPRGMDLCPRKISSSRSSLTPCSRPRVPNRGCRTPVQRCCRNRRSHSRSSSQISVAVSWYLAASSSMRTVWRIRWRKYCP